MDEEGGRDRAKRNKNLKTDDNVTRERSVSSRYRSEREDAVKT